MGFVGTTVDRILNRFGYTKAKPEDVVRFELRQGAYSTNQMLYDGTIYEPTFGGGGALEDVLDKYIGIPRCDIDLRLHRIRPMFLPVREIVEVYQHVMPGVWGKGKGVEVASDINGRSVNPRLLDPLSRIWIASNLDSEKAKLITWAANFGTVGIRIAATAGLDGKPPRVTIAADHPSRLFNFEEDGEGNVTAVALKYRKNLNRGTLIDPQWESVEVVETFAKDEFSLTYDGDEQLADDERPNRLGFCPYLIARHKDNGTPYGSWAYQGSEASLHEINWRITRQGRSIARNELPRWFLTGGGDKPEEINLGDSKGHYVTTAEGTPPPTMQAIVPQIDQSASQAFWMEERDMLRGRQPELNLGDVKLLGNTSGEALAQILKPTEKAILDVRPNYQHAFVRAMQMAVSAGIQVGAWDIGSGVGSIEASDAAYRTGLEDFGFVPQPALPPTVYQLTQQAQAETAQAKAKLQTAQQAKAIGLPVVEQWRMAGYTDEQIAELKREKRAEAREGDTIEDPDASDPATL